MPLDEEYVPTPEEEWEAHKQFVQWEMAAIQERERDEAEKRRTLDTAVGGFTFDHEGRMIAYLPPEPARFASDYDEEC